VQRGLTTIRQHLPFFANTVIASNPRRAAISAVLIAGIATGPLTGTTHHTDTAAARVAGVMTGQSAPAPAPSQGQLMPNGVPGDQSHIALGGAQVDNAKAIIKATKEDKMPPRAAVIAVATSIQETKLINYGDLGTANDHDSLGLFQQRPSAGWGSPDQLTNPDYATKAFLNGLKNVNGWQSMPLTDAAQSVQVSAFGDRYAQWEQQAAQLVHDNYGKS
jgi:hypothetical protein